jgi:hypothetical protein
MFEGLNKTVHFRGSNFWRRAFFLNPVYLVQNIMSPVPIEKEAQARIRPGKSQAKAKFHDF